MKTKIVKTILPTILGILSVIGLLIVYNDIFYNGDFLKNSDNGFFKFLLPITTVFAILIQFALTLPIWERFKSHNKVLGLRIIPFTSIIIIVAGLTFGLVFWEINIGINELFAVSLTGIIAFAIYWTVNLLTLKKLDKMLNDF
jgi:hypothetical protein